MSRQRPLQAQKIMHLFKEKKTIFSIRSVNCTCGKNTQEDFNKTGEEFIKTDAKSDKGKITNLDASCWKGEWRENTGLTSSGVQVRSIS